jgi:hypothetical protein
MSHRQWLALMLGLLLVCAPLIRAEEEEYDDDDSDDSKDEKGGEEKDVVVITKDNFESKIKGSKFALVSRRGRARGPRRRDRERARCPASRLVRAPPPGRLRRAPLRCRCREPCTGRCAAAEQPRPSPLTRQTARVLRAVVRPLPGGFKPPAWAGAPAAAAARRATPRLQAGAPAPSAAAHARQPPAPNALDRRSSPPAPRRNSRPSTPRPRPPSRRTTPPS